MYFRVYFLRVKFQPINSFKVKLFVNVSVTSYCCLLETVTTRHGDNPNQPHQMSSRLTTSFLRHASNRVLPVNQLVSVRLFHVTRVNQDVSSINDLDHQNKVQSLRRYLADITRLTIPKKEYFELAKSAGLDEKQATDLLPHLHQSGVALYYPENPVLNDVVVVQPQQVTQSMNNLLDVNVLGRELAKHRAELSEIEQQVAPMREKKRELDRRAKNRINTYLFMGFGYLATQTTVLAKMTWIDFGWDVVEPITYFVTFSVALIGYSYFLLMRREYTYGDALNMATNRRRRIEYKKAGFDYHKYSQLEKAWRDKADQIRQECLHVYGKVPQEFNDVMEKVRRQVKEGELFANDELKDATRPEGAPHEANPNAKTTLVK
jgi:hypothetical protein